jgi:hypothetical protein
MSKNAKKEGLTKKEVERRERVLKITYLQLDALETTDTLEIFCSVIKDMLAASLEDKQITDEEHEKRHIEVTTAELHFKKEKINLEKFKSILINNLKF